MKRIRRFIVTSPLLAVFLSLVLGVAVAFGAFLAYQNYDVSLTAEAQPNVNPLVINCVLTGKGSVDTCSYVGSDSTIVLSGIDDESTLTVTQSIQNLDTIKVASFNQTADPAVSSQTCTDTNTTDPCEGLVLAVDQYLGTEIVLEFANITPSQSVSITDLSVSFENQ